MTPAECRLGLRARMVNRLRRSTREVRLALPYSNLKIMTPSQAAAITDFGRAFANCVDQGDMQTAGLTVGGFCHMQTFAAGDLNDRPWS
jgi:hypothetical protein